MRTIASFQNVPDNFCTATRRFIVGCVLIFFGLALLCCAGAQAATHAQSWRIDEAQTWVGFKIDAVGFLTTHGHFAHCSGQVLIDFDRAAKSYTIFTVESASVDVGFSSFNEFVKSAALLDAE